MMNKLLMTRRVVLVASLLLTSLLLGAGPATADSFTFTTGNSIVTNIGNDGCCGTNYDILQLTSVSGTTGDVGMGPQTVQIGTVDFTVGYNCNGSGPQCPKSQGTIPFTVTVNGQTLTLSIPYSDVIGNSDTLTMGSATVWFALATGGFLELTTLPYGPDVNGVIGGTDVGPLDGIFSYSATTPEPLSMVLFGTFLGVAGVLRRRRRS